jgi:hypothetical protein
MEDLAIPMEKGKLVDALWLLPFVFWYGAIAIQGLEWDIRLGLLKMAFHIFVDWYQPYHRCTKGNLNGCKFFVEIPDLKRYIITTLFLYHPTGQRTSIAYNRIGTRPIENLFGYVHVNSHFDHTWSTSIIPGGCASSNYVRPSLKGYCAYFFTRDTFQTHIHPQNTGNMLGFAKIARKFVARCDKSICRTSNQKGMKLY